MKNIFTVLAVALLACSMLFVSCKKDKVAENATTVTIGETSWVATDFYGDVTKIADDMLIIAGSEDYSQDIPYIQGFVGATAENTYAMKDGYAIGYFESESDVDANGYGNWQATAASQEVTAIDLNAKTISAIATQTMKNNKTNEADVAMEVNMNNATWVNRDLAKGRK